MTTPPPPLLASDLARDPACGSRYDCGGRMPQVTCALVSEHHGRHYAASESCAESFWTWDDAAALTEGSA